MSVGLIPRVLERKKTSRVVNSSLRKWYIAPDVRVWRELQFEEFCQWNREFM